MVVIGAGRLVADGPVAELTAGGAGLEETFFQLTGEAS